MGEWSQKIQEALSHAVDFFKEAWRELAKVHWPPRKETYTATLVVIVMILIVSVFLAIVDYALTWAIQKMLT
jgi:preprotein translocase subunit SecE